MTRHGQICSPYPAQVHLYLIIYIYIYIYIYKFYIYHIYNINFYTFSMIIPKIFVFSLLILLQLSLLSLPFYFYFYLINVKVISLGIKNTSNLCYPWLISHSLHMYFSCFKEGIEYEWGNLDLTLPGPITIPISSTNFLFIGYFWRLEAFFFFFYHSYLIHKLNTKKWLLLLKIRYLGIP